MEAISYYNDFQYQANCSLAEMLQGDPYLKSLVAGRVYPQHISTIDNPVFPAITFEFNGGRTDPSIPQISYGSIVFDVWSKKGVPELWQIFASCHATTNAPQGIRALMLNSSLGDFPHVSVDKITEDYVKDNLYQPWNMTFHLQASYGLSMAGKTVIIS